MQRIDLSVWKQAPKPRTPQYISTYSAISRNVQRTIRSLVLQEIRENPKTLNRTKVVFPLLVYASTIPHIGRTYATFTYEILDRDSVRKAFSSAAFHLGHTLRALPTEVLSRSRRELYLPYRSDEIIAAVWANMTPFYRSLQAEALIVKAILKFALEDIERFGLETALGKAKRAIARELSRISEELELCRHVDDVLKAATDTLVVQCFTPLSPKRA